MLDLTPIKLKANSHPDPSKGSCAMEVVAWIAGEDHTDHPECACPVITAFVIPTNDWMNDEERQLLLPYILRISGSRASTEVMVKRAQMCADTARNVFVAIAAQQNAKLAASLAAAGAWESASCAAKFAPAGRVWAVREGASEAASLAAASASAASAAACDNVSIRKQLIAARLKLLDDMLKLTDPVETPVVRPIEQLLELQEAL